MYVAILDSQPAKRSVQKSCVSLSSSPRPAQRWANSAASRLVPAMPPPLSAAEDILRVLEVDLHGVSATERQLVLRYGLPIAFFVTAFKK